MARTLDSADVENPLAELVRRSAERDGSRNFLELARSASYVTFSELAEEVSRWAGLVGEMGVPAGVTIGLAVADPLDFCVLYLGTMASGRWAAPLDPNTPPERLGPLMGRLGASLVVRDAEAHPAQGVPWVQCTPGTFDPRGSGQLVVHGAPWVSGQQPAGVRGAPGDDRGGALLASSGTTGAPKLIPLAVDRLLHNAWSIADHHRLGPGERGFNPLPLFHINAQVVALLASLVSGSSLVLDARFHRTGFWELMARRRISWINAVPAIISHLSVVLPDEAVPSQIRFIRSASAPLSPATLTRFEAATGIPVLETYGMTEGASQITANPLAGVRKPGTVGVPVGTEVRVVAHAQGSGDGPAARPEVDEASPVGSVGRVEIRGRSIIDHYAGNQHPDRFSPDGWLRTGDLGFLDSDGYLTLVGRTDDVINRSGEKVYPSEIEDAMLADPDVLKAAVVAMRDEVLGQVPAGYVVLREAVEGSDPAPARRALERIEARLAATLVRAKRPVVLHAVASLPQGPTGKVLRRAVPQHCSRPLCSVVLSRR